MSTLYRSQAIVGEAEPPFGTYAPRGLQAAMLRFAHVPPFYRGTFRRPMADLIRWLGRDGIVDVTADGLSFRLRSASNLIEDGILVHPAYNRVEIDFLLAGTPGGGVFVDLGANVGLYTLPLARKAGPSGRVLAIDANPDIVGAIAFNVAASGLDNVAIACVAVGEAEGRAHLEIRKDDIAIVEIEEDPEGDIEIRPLRDVVEEAGLARVDSLKADIEGYEDRALIPYLDGAPEALKPGRIVIEHLGRHTAWKTDCFVAFERHGYRLVGQTRGNSLFSREGSR
jgi:FkbM family methyltransferase